MTRKRKVLCSLFAVLSLSWLMAGDCEIDLDGFGGFGWPGYFYDPGPVYYDPGYVVYDPYYY